MIFQIADRWQLTRRKRKLGDIVHGIHSTLAFWGPVMTSCKRLALAVLVLSLVVLPASNALAHPGHPGHDFGDGFAHPMLGLDHLLAMVAVGLLAVRIGGAGLWIMPVSFLTCMLVGGLAAAAGVPLPGVEYGIMASVLVLGLLVASTRIAPLALGAVLVAAFAFCHGHAHAAEMVSGGSLGPYAAGFLLSTALLHTAGIGLGYALSKWIDLRTVRWTGGAITAAGLLMFVGVL